MNPGPESIKPTLSPLSHQGQVILTRNFIEMGKDKRKGKDERKGMEVGRKVTEDGTEGRERRMG